MVGSRSLLRPLVAAGILAGAAAASWASGADAAGTVSPCVPFRLSGGERTLYSGQTVRLYRVCVHGGGPSIRVVRDGTAFPLPPDGGRTACADAEGATIAVAAEGGATGRYCLLEGMASPRPAPGRRPGKPPGSPAAGKRCFVFAGQSYCE